mgnify:CR=1 FL=1
MSILPLRLFATHFVLGLPFVIALFWRLCRLYCLCDKHNCKNRDYTANDSQNYFISFALHFLCPFILYLLFISDTRKECVFHRRRLLLPLICMCKGCLCSFFRKNTDLCQFLNCSMFQRFYIPTIFSFAFPW